MREKTNNSTTVISQRKAEATILKLKNRKLFGLHNINNELLKYRGNELIDEIHTLFHKIYDQQKVPAEWKLSTTISVF